MIDGPSRCGLCPWSSLGKVQRSWSHVHFSVDVVPNLHASICRKSHKNMKSCQASIPV